MQSGFAESILNRDDHRVFGRRMQPLCAAHLLYLEATGNAIFRGEKLTLGDLLMAARVCSMRPRLIGGVWRVPYFSASIFDRLQFELNSIFPRIFERNCLAWMAYVEDYLQQPSKCETPDFHGKAISSPAVVAAVVRASSIFGEARAWSMPYGYLRACLDVSDELSGGVVRFEPDEDEIAETEQALAEADRAGAELLRQWEEQEALTNG